MAQQPSLGRAFEIAFAAHAGQRDKAGEAYIAHPVRVASRLKDRAAQVVALLHDVVEDTDVTLDDLARDFDAQIVAAVDAITKRDGEGYESYLARVAENALALEVKRADLAGNSDPERMARLTPEARTRLELKYAKAREVLA